MIVDASAMVEVLLQSSKAALIQRILLAEESWDAPHLIDVEVTQVLRRFVLRNELQAPRADISLKAFRNFGLTRHPHLPLLRRIWALRQNMSAYDATYVALAEALDAPLITCDGRLAKAAERLVEVMVV